ncbi:hypothetical protein KXD40_008738 [Peronospora effusa]|uniref:Uncharacterized protein n=1 Tax=Peronospora effusa TaxID=542832 RepID=A0A3M6VV72_9STRA|nr:hypothetical protein DD238_006345 [Peronospora effusa]RQM18806.1 hypothetical protein DD237_007449 [Peronospora effusa]UIZ21891.1 hypothetical protein KXD40_008738 [Peronospora effusa]CAI5705232.1 unnamed protein product [Peronospora effusa]
MKVRRRWLKLALVTIVLMLKPANTQVYTMRSDLGEDSKSSLDTGKDLSNMKTSTPTAKTDAPPETDETPAKAPHALALPEMESAPRPTSNNPNETPPEISESKMRLRHQQSLDWDTLLDSNVEETIAGLKTSGKSSVESGKSENEEKSDKEKEFEKEFEKETNLEEEKEFGKETKPEKETESDESGSPAAKTKEKKNLVHPADGDSELDEAGSLPSRTPKTSLDTTLGSDAASPSKSSLKSAKPIKQEPTLEPTNIEQNETPSEIQDTDATKDVHSTESEASPASDAGSSSPPTSVLTDSANAETGGMSNTVMLGLMMGIAIALGMLVAVFVYVKTREKEDVEKIDPILWSVRQDRNKGTVQSSTVASDFHENDMSPMNYNDDNYYSKNQHHDRQYDQHHHGNSASCGDSVVGVLTPRSQIVLAHSQMSLPPMAHSGHSNASSQYSNFTAQSDFYGNSGYSAASSSVSQDAKNYPRRRGKGRNDSGSEDESDYEGDTIQDMSYAANKWKSSNRRGPAASGMDSRFDPSDSRSTSASDYNGKNRFKDSEYTEYRMSTGYDNSHVGGGGYDSSFASSKSGSDSSFNASHSGYDKSFAASDSGYESRHTDGKRFTSSGYSEYAAPPRNRGSDSTSLYRTKESRFTDAAYK